MITRKKTKLMECPVEPISPLTVHPMILISAQHQKIHTKACICSTSPVQSNVISSRIAKMILTTKLSKNSTKKVKTDHSEENDYSSIEKRPPVDTLNKIRAPSKPIVHQIELQKREKQKEVSEFTDNDTVVLESARPLATQVQESKKKSTEDKDERDENINHLEAPSSTIDNTEASPNTYMADGSPNYSLLSCNLQKKIWINALNQSYSAVCI